MHQSKKPHELTLWDKIVMAFKRCIADLFWVDYERTMLDACELCKGDSTRCKGQYVKCTHCNWAGCVVEVDITWKGDSWDVVKLECPECGKSIQKERHP